MKGLGGQSTGAGYIHFEDHQSAKVSRHAALKQTLHFPRDATLPRALTASIKERLVTMSMKSNVLTRLYC